MKKVEDNKILNEIISSLKNYNEDYINGSWERFQKKRERKKRRKVLIAIFSGGIAAILLLSFIVYNTLQYNAKTNSQRILRTENKKIYHNEKKSNDRGLTYTDSISHRSRMLPMKKIESRNFQITAKKGNAVLASCKLTMPDELHLKQNSDEITVPADSSKKIVVPNENTVLTKNPNTINYRQPKGKSNHKKISFGFLVKESMNSTSSSSSMSFALGMVNEMEFNHKFSFNTGVILDKYNLNYKQEMYSEHDPTSENVELLCLDIPFNLKMKLTEMKQSHIFISGGISTLVFLNEKYIHEYVYAEPSETTVRFQNINFAGQLNLSSGYQYRISDKMNVTVEAYLKIPLYKLAEEELHFYQSGISVKISK